MAERQTNRHCLYASLLLHGAILAMFIVGLDFYTTLPVIENTNQHDVISAVVLGDTAKSKILTPKVLPPPPKMVKTIAKALPAKAVKLPVIDKEAIALKIQRQKQLLDKKNLQKKQEALAKDLLTDIKRLDQAKTQQVKQKALEKDFEKTLKIQAEKSMRQELMNERVKLSADKLRQTQGVVNKYQALILQAISQKWNIPPDADKNSHCALLIRLAPSGTVLDVQISQSSGNSELDRSARAAVLKASPLPVPPEAEAFAEFRQFVLNVRPQDVLDNAMP